MPSRKRVLEYDDVMNKQRETIYGQRASVLNGESLKDTILKMTESTDFRRGGSFPGQR